MITTILLSIINFFWYGFIDLVWIKELPGLTLSVFQGMLNFFTNSLLPLFQIVDVIVPMNIVTAIILGIIGVWTLIFGVKIVRFTINLIRPTASV